MSAAVAAARPSQALRQRRESQRPRVVAKPSMANGAPKEDTRRHVTRPEDILAKFNGRPPSLRIYLYQNHFRLNDSQETLSYASPMRELLDHVRHKTVPHNMLEDLHAMGVQFYDSCLIVEVHNFRSSGVKAKEDTHRSTEGAGTKPFSIHNNSNFITPSPHAAHPATLKTSDKAEPAEAQNPGADAKPDKDMDKENMPAPGQPASQKQGSKAKVTTAVLFPTPQSHLADVTQLANTPLPDVATLRRNQAAARAAGNPPTPLTAVPPTPTALTAGRSPKRQKMVLDENNLHEFESAVLNETCPKLYLEPTKSFGDTLALMEASTHPNNQHSPPTRKTRKRTTAELAADEAEAADMQRYMLAGDEHQTSNTTAAAGGDESQHAVRAGANQQTFSRFKTLAAIKTNHEEAERRKKEEEARQAQVKRQAQQDAAEVAKRRELEASHQAEQQNAASAMLQKKQEAMARQQQQQQQQQQALVMQMANANAQVSQTPLSATQPQFSSPVVRQQTPMAAAASPLNQVHTTHPMGGTPMVATSSNHAAGSPARPPSAISHHPNTMARTVSQQQHQNLSRTGTPQLLQGTPVMNAAMPARNISSTPTPRMNNQGSPNMPVPGATPIMMHTPQPGQNMTPEQMQFLQNQNVQTQLRAQGMPSTNISPTNHQQFQQAAFHRANMHIQANGIPPNQNPTQYRQGLASRIYQQLQQQQQQRMATNMSPGMPQAGTPNAGQTQLANVNLQQLRQQYNARKQQLLAAYGPNVPQQHVVQMNQMEANIRQREAQVQQQQQQVTQQQAMTQSGQMNMQGMPNHMNMQGGGNPQASVQMQQYQQMLQQQRVQQQRQNQIMQLRQQAAMQQGGQMNMNNMQAGFNVNNMGNMGNMNGMNMASMQAMNQGNMGNMGMQGMQSMQGMNMSNMQGMSQQQMQQMMMMRQAQARAAMQQQGQQQQQGGDMNWSGV